MEMLGRIRRMHLRDKVSLHEIARRTGLSRNTVRRWLRTPEEVKTPQYVRAKGFGKLKGFTQELDQALTRADGATLYQSTVNGVKIEVIKVGNNVTAAYPCGRGCTSLTTFAGQ